MKYLTEQQIDRITSETGTALKKEQKVRLTIAPDALGSHWEGGINGHFFRIRKGVEVELPKSLAKLIAQSAQVKLENEQQTMQFKGAGKRIG